MPLGIAADSTTIDMGNTTAINNNHSSSNNGSISNSYSSSSSSVAYEYEPNSKVGMKLREQQIVRHIYRPAAVSKHSNVSIADLISRDIKTLQKFR